MIRLCACQGNRDKKERIYSQLEINKIYIAAINYVMVIVDIIREI